MFKCSYSVKQENLPADHTLWKTLPAAAIQNAQVQVNTVEKFSRGYSARKRWNTRSVAQVESLRSMCEALASTPSPGISRGGVGAAAHLGSLVPIRMKHTDQV